MATKMVATWRVGLVARQHMTFTLSQNAACSDEFFLWQLQVDYALEENVLTEQM